ncbi:MAG: shikimate kinase [Phycisphaerae bacterium]|nr:shikimate kinase [Phycisphaerae bacterium]
MNLILVGYRGSGKSTVGSFLAKRLGWTFVDLDALVVQRAGRTVAQIFAQEGEAGFRRRERDTWLSIRKSNRQVIALGGGALTDPDIRAKVKRIGKVVWLRAPAAVLWSRINQDVQSPDTRPDLTRGGGLTEIEALLKHREPLYRRAADQVVDTVGGTPEGIADAIETWYRADAAPERDQAPFER